MTTINKNSPFQSNAIQTATLYIADLHTDHEAWRNAERKANDVLTDLLVKCLHLYELMSGASAEAETLRCDFAAYIKNSKLRFNGETHTVQKIAGVVFNINDDKYNRRHASHYGRVLRNAHDAGIVSSGLKAYIVQNGGVTKLATSNSSSPASTADRAEAAWTALKSSTLANVSGTSFAKAIDAANVGQRVLLLATQRANATFDVHAVVQSTSLVDSAYASKLDALKPAANQNTAAELDTARAKIVANTKA